VARWVALGWLAVWVPSYLPVYGWNNFLQFCDVAVFFTVIGLWRGSALLLSSQAVAVLVVDALWTVDVAGRLILGRHIVGGTEYMWSPSYPLFVRLLSLFHIVWPLILLWAVRRTGYDRRGWVLQSGIAVVVFVATRLWCDGHNFNFVMEAPFIRRPMGPVPVHLLLSWLAAVAGMYLPAHFLIARLVPPRPRWSEGHPGSAVAPR